MIPILFEYDETDFTTHGIGDLVDCLECKAKQTSEGEYEMSFSYPASGQLFSELQNGRIVLAKVNDYQDPQCFRIYGIESGLNQTVTVNCQHISYDMANYPVKIFKDQLSPAQAIATLKKNILPINSGMAESFPFNISGYQIQGFNSQRAYTRGEYVINGGYTWQAIEDIPAGNVFDQDQWTALEKFNVESPKNVRETLLDGDDSILGLYGGDIVFDNMSVSIEKSAGLDRGVTIEYGVDLVDFSQDKNITEMVTGVLPYWKGSIRGSGNGSLGNRFEVYTGDQFEEGYTYYTRNPTYTPTSDTSFNLEKTYYIQSGNTYSGITLDDMDFKPDVTYYESAGFGYIPTDDTALRSGETYYVLDNGTYREINGSDLDFNPNITYYELPHADPDPEPQPDPDPDPEPKQVIYVVANYDSENNLVNASVYDEDANLIYQRRYVRDASTGEYTDAVNDVDTLQYVSTADQFGKIISVKCYDETGNLIVQQQYNNGILNSVTISNNDHEVIVETYNNGEISNITVTNPDTDPSSEPEPEPEPEPESDQVIFVVPDYDDGQNLVGVSVYDKNATLFYKKTYVRDANTGAYTDVVVDIDELKQYTQQISDGVVTHRFGWYWSDATAQESKLIVTQDYNKENSFLQTIRIHNRDSHDVIVETYNDGVIYDVAVTDPDSIPEPEPDVSIVLEYGENHNRLLLLSAYDKNHNLIHRRRYDRNASTGKILDVIIDVDELTSYGSTSNMIYRQDETNKTIVDERYTNGVLDTIFIYNQNHQTVVNEYYDDNGKIYSISVNRDNADNIIYSETNDLEDSEVQTASVVEDNDVQSANILSSNSNESIGENNDDAELNSDGYVITSDEHYNPNKTYYIEKEVNIMDDYGGVITYVYSPVTPYDLIFKSGLTVYVRSITGYKKTSDTSYQRGKKYYLATTTAGLYIPVDFKDLTFRQGTTYFEETSFNYVQVSSKQPGIIYYVAEEINDKETTVYGSIQYAEGFSTLPSSAQKIELLDLSEFFEAEKDSQIPSAARLEKKARQYVLANDIGIPAIDLTVQYASLHQDVRLYDAITVKFPKLGISTKAKVSSYSYDVLREICTEIEVKNAKASSTWSTLEDASRLRKGIIAPSRIGKKSITSEHIGTGQVESSNIATGGVGSPQIKPSAVTDTKVADNAITVNKIANGAVKEAKIGDLAVSSQKIANLAVEYAKLAGGSVDDNKFTHDMQVTWSDVLATRALFAGYIYSEGVMQCKSIIVNGIQFNSYITYGSSGRRVLATSYA